MRFKVRNLVSHKLGAADNLDQLLRNAWGIINFQDKLWVVSNDKFPEETNYFVRVYSKTGLLLAAIEVFAAFPTGIAINKSKGFVVSSPDDSKNASCDWLVCTQNGAICGFSPLVDPLKAYVVVTSRRAFYTGIALHENNLYVADFNGRKIDTYDSNYNLIPLPFIDNTLPADYFPFNIVVVKNELFVLYAKRDLQDPDPYNFLTGTGFGYISVFNFDGTFVRRFVNQGELNAPWGLIKSPKYCDKFKDAILVGNNGDGNINIYNKHGTFLGKLKDEDRNVIILDKLWGLSKDNCKVYFASGPEYIHSLVGSISPK